MKVKAKANLIHQGAYIPAGTVFDVPADEADLYSGIEPLEDPLKAEEFSGLIKAVEKAKAGEQINTNPLKPDLIFQYAALMGIETEGRNKSDVFADIVKEAKQNDGTGQPES